MSALYLPGLSWGWVRDSRRECGTRVSTLLCVLSGKTYLYAKLTFDSDVYPNGVPNISVILKGKKFVSIFSNFSSIIPIIS